MKLKAYLIKEGHFGHEIEDQSTIYNLIKKECKPYTKLVGNKPFYRGMYAGSHPWIKRDVRQDRQATGMDSDIYWGFNEWLKKKGGAQRSKSVICTSDEDWAGDFGHPYMIYPIGNFKYSWLYARDVNIPALTTNYSPGYMYMKWAGGDDGEEFAAEMIYREINKRAPSKDEWLSFAKKLTDDWFKKKGVVNNKGIHIAYNKEYEIWFECKQYYAVKFG